MDNHRCNPPLLKVEDHLVRVMRHIIVRKLQHQVTIASISKENIVLIECRQQLPVNPNLLARPPPQRRGRLKLGSHSTTRRSSNRGDGGDDDGDDAGAPRSWSVRPGCAVNTAYLHQT